MLAIVRQKTPPAGRERAVNDWLRGRAVDGAGGGDRRRPERPGRVKELDRIISNPAESPSCVARRPAPLSGLEFPSDRNLDFKSLADHIGHLAVDVCKEKIDRAEQPRSICSAAASRI